MTRDPGFRPGSFSRYRSLPVMTVSGIRGKPSLHYKYYMIGIKEMVSYHDKTDGDSCSTTERFFWEDSPLMIKLSRISRAMKINFEHQIPSKIVIIKEDKTKEYPREQCHGINGLYIDFLKPYWNNITIIFDNGMTTEYNIPDDTETLSTDLTQYIESNYEKVPVYNEWSQAAALLDDDMLDI